MQASFIKVLPPWLNDRAIQPLTTNHVLAGIDHSSWRGQPCHSFCLAGCQLDTYVDGNKKSKSSSVSVCDRGENPAGSKSSHWDLEISSGKIERFIVCFHSNLFLFHYSWATVNIWGFHCGSKELHGCGSVHWPWSCCVGQFWFNNCR